MWRIRDREVKVKLAQFNNCSNCQDQQDSDLTTEANSCNRDYMAHKQNIYYLVLSGKKASGFFSKKYVMI